MTDSEELCLALKELKEVQDTLDKASKLLQELSDEAAFAAFASWELSDDLVKKQYEVYLFLESVKS